MIAALALALLVVGDATCSGVRAVVGRDAHLDVRALVRRGARRGAILGASVVGAVVGLVAVGGLVGLDLGDGLAVLAARGLVALGPFGALAGLGLLGYLRSSLDVRCLAVAIVLGPCTLARPVVLIAAGVATAWSSPAGAWLVVTAVTGVLLAAEALLGRRMRTMPPAGLVAGLPMSSTTRLT